MRSRFEGADSRWMSYHICFLSSLKGHGDVENAPKVWRKANMT